ncbi:MAG: hypothetical protein CMO81_00005 [Waddliaceae bacterium]|nr:hypothetical protein [Waddliaceae bacterium]
MSVNAPESYYIQLQKEKWETLKKWVEQRQEENLYLEFKQSDIEHFNSKGKPIKKDRELFCEQVSGFANSAGGVLVFGIATSEESQVDGASEIIPIPKVDSYISYFRENVYGWFAPSDLKLEFLSVKDPEDDTQGVMVVYVPEYDGDPVMNMQNDKVKGYYKRSGESTVKMEHYEIADRFGKRPHPQLEICAKIKRGSWTHGRSISVQVVLGIRNTGRGSARFPYISVTSKNQHFQSWKMPSGLDSMFTKYDGELYGKADISLAPGKCIWVTYSDISISWDEIKNDVRCPKGDILDVEVSLGAEDVPMRSQHLSCGDYPFAEFARHYLIRTNRETAELPEFSLEDFAQFRRGGGG